MSLGAKIAVSAMRGVKKTSLIKGPSADLDAELRKAKKYNRKHPYARLCESQNRGVKAVRILGIRIPSRIVSALSSQVTG